MPLVPDVTHAPVGDSAADVPFQNQAVLRRATRSTPLALVGVTLDSKFYPDSVDHAEVEPAGSSSTTSASSPRATWRR